MSPRSHSLRRRRLLSAIAALAGTSALAGCSALWDQPGATDVVLYNAASEAQTVSVTITDVDDDDPHASRTLEVGAGERIDPVNPSKLPMNAEYTVRVAVEGGPTETFEWDDPRLELAPLYVLVDETDNVAFLLQAG